MTGVRKHFADLTKSDVDLDFELGNDSKIKAVGRGTVSFRRELQQSMVVRDVLYVPGLAKSLMSVSAIEDRGYEVILWMNRYSFIIRDPLLQQQR